MKNWEAIYLPWCALATILIFPILIYIIPPFALALYIEWYVQHRKRMKTVDYLIDHVLPPHYPYRSKSDRRHFLSRLNLFYSQELEKEKDPRKYTEINRKYWDGILEEYPYLNHRYIMGEWQEDSGLYFRY